MFVGYFSQGKYCSQKNFGCRCIAPLLGYLSYLSNFSVNSTQHGFDSSGHDVVVFSDAEVAAVIVGL
jgi:hypothetical protein